VSIPISIAMLQINLDVPIWVCIYYQRKKEQFQTPWNGFAVMLLCFGSNLICLFVCLFVCLLLSPMTIARKDLSNSTES